MKKILLSQKDFEFMRKEMPYAYAFIKDKIVNEGNYYSINLDIGNDLLSQMNDDIVDFGLDKSKDYEPTPKGKKMYDIYDTIHYQGKCLINGEEINYDWVL